MPPSLGPVRRLALTLAATAEADPRPCARAIERGSRAVRGLAGERIARAMRELGIPDPDPVSTDPPRPAA